MKSALIIGITGQDGSYLAEHLLAQGYAVHGLVRRASMFNRSRIDHLRRQGSRASPSAVAKAMADRPDEPSVAGVADPGLVTGQPGSATPATGSSSHLVLHYGDLSDLTSIRRLLKEISPREVYHLAGQSHVGLSFEMPEVTCAENGMATLGLLEALRELDYPVRFYHAASSEIFGAPGTAPQTEVTPFRPVNPYGCAKAFATQLCRVYREAHGLFACSGIAYNHESPRRGENFVTRKITLGAARIKAGQLAALALGNLDARRDWGYAPEYVTAMWQMLQAEKPADYILATGRATSVREFASAAFGELGMDLQFEGRGVDEVGRRADTGAIVLTVDPRYYRPTEATNLVGDSALAARELGWSATTTGAAVARLMARADAIAARPES